MAARCSVTTVNGVNERLAEVVKDLDKLPAQHDAVPRAVSRHLQLPPDRQHQAGCRCTPSAAALDINTKHTDYWEWSKGKDGGVTWRNRIPGAIGEIFERHGFIWGAKWYHFDTMHSSTGREIIALASKAGHMV